VLRTAAPRLKALEERLHQMHSSYEAPEFLVLEVSSCSASYLAWLLAVLA